MKSFLRVHSFLHIFSFYNCKTYYCYVLALMILVLILMLNDLGMSSICPCWILYICFDFFHCACLQKTTTNIRYSTHLWDAEVKRFAFGGFLLDDFFVFSAPSTHAVLSKVEWKECYFRNDSIQMCQTFIQIISMSGFLFNTWQNNKTVWCYDRKMIAVWFILK